MSPVLRSVLAVVAGVLTNIVVVSGGEFLTSRLFPFPAALAAAPSAELESALRAMPPAAFASILAVTLVGALLSGIVAGRLAATPRWVGFVITALLLLGNTTNAFSFWHPSWFRAAAVVLPGALGWWGARLGARRN